MRVIVTGNRDWTDEATILRALMTLPLISTVVHGACSRGADVLADRIARAMGHVTELHPADWSTHGKAAGPIRNAHMVSLGADACYAFGALERNGKRTGTGDCVERARQAGIPVMHWETPDDQNAEYVRGALAYVATYTEGSEPIAPGITLTEALADPARVVLPVWGAAIAAMRIPYDGPVDFNALAGFVTSNMKFVSVDAGTLASIGLRALCAKTRRESSK